MSESSDLQLTDYIRDIPDFPKPGILFRDITPLLADPEAFCESVRQMSRQVAGRKIDAIAAAEARGFLFAAPMAVELKIPLIPVRKPGKLPYETMAHTYELEYGSDTMEIHTDAVAPGANVLVVDDLLATGGTIEACCRLIEKAGGRVEACLFLIELSFLEGAKKISEYECISLLKYD